MKLLVLLVTFICPAILFAQGVSPELAAVPSEITDVVNLLGPSVISFLKQYPIVVKFLVFIGVARPILKPLNSLVWTIVNATSTKSDDEKYKKLKGSKAFGVAAYLIDVLASVKVKNPKGK